MANVLFTHTGRLGICPVYLAEIDSDAPVVVPRHWLFAPLLTLSQIFYHLIFFYKGFTDPKYEAEWSIAIIDELEEPLRRRVEWKE